MINHIFRIPRPQKEVAAVADNKSEWPWTGEKPKTVPQEDKVPWYRGAFSGSSLFGRLSKLDYALYIKNMPTQKGDIIIHTSKINSDGSVPNHDLYSFYRVVDIQEMHNHVDYVGNNPNCLWIKPVDNKGVGFWSSPVYYTVVNPLKAPTKLAKFLEEVDDDKPLI